MLWYFEEIPEIDSAQTHNEAFAANLIAVLKDAEEMLLEDAQSVHVGFRRA